MQGEYRGDFTRDTFDPLKHFSRVLMQQGRVQLDADWNEQTAILLHYVRSQAADLIGQHGGAGAGFKVEQLHLGSPPSPTGDFVIDLGNYYVDGILCENDNPVLTVQPVSPATGVGNSNQVRIIAGFGSESVPALKDKPVDFSSDNFQTFVRVQIKDVDKTGQILTLPVTLVNLSLTSLVISLRRVTTYLSQPDFPKPDSLGKADSPKTLPLLVYLDVWERHLTYVEDENIREIALGGPETASRAKVVWQVRTNPNIPNGATPPVSKNYYLNDHDWSVHVAGYLQFANRGMLKARVQPQAIATEPCTISPQSSYRGAENQLYRVEIHSPGGKSAAGQTIPATFKWSRENGSVVFPILNIATSSGRTTLNLANLGRDERLSLKVNDWVEVVDDDSILSGGANPLLQVQSIDAPTMTVTLNGTVTLATDKLSTKHPLLRRWEDTQSISESNGSQNTDWTSLEDGIQIQFQPLADTSIQNHYRTGDYWLFPARVASGDIEWPRLRDAQGNLVLDSSNQPIPDALPPHGVEHHFAPLAVITVDAEGNVTSSATNLRRTLETQAK